MHGACVRDGSWWRHRTAKLLEQRGVSSVSPALPNCGETGLPVGGDGPRLAEDVDAVREVLRSSDEATVVVAHSYGGIVTAEAVAGVASVRHLLLISSYLPEVGQTVTAAAWQQVPSTYLVCARDRGTSAERQREYARRAGAIVELDAGHHPFFSQPAAVRDLILTL